MNKLKILELSSSLPRDLEIIFNDFLNCKNQYFKNLEDLKHFIQADHQKVFTLLSFSNPKKEKEILGFIAFQVKPIGNILEADLVFIFIDHEFRKKGLASFLLGEASRILIENFDSLEIYLEVRKSNFSAISFYHKHDFERIGHRKEYYSKPKEDAVQMALKKTKIEVLDLGII